MAINHGSERLAVTTTTAAQRVIGSTVPDGHVRLVKELRFCNFGASQRNISFGYEGIDLMYPALNPGEVLTIGANTMFVAGDKFASAASTDSNLAVAISYVEMPSNLTAEPFRWYSEYGTVEAQYTVPAGRRLVVREWLFYSSTRSSRPNVRVPGIVHTHAHAPLASLETRITPCFSVYEPGTVLGVVDLLAGQTAGLSGTFVMTGLLERV